MSAQISIRKYCPLVVETGYCDDDACLEDTHHRSWLLFIKRLEKATQVPLENYKAACCKHKSKGAANPEDRYEYCPSGDLLCPYAHGSEDKDKKLDTRAKIERIYKGLTLLREQYPDPTAFRHAAVPFMKGFYF